MSKKILKQFKIYNKNQKIKFPLKFMKIKTISL